MSWLLLTSSSFWIPDLVTEWGWAACSTCKKSPKWNILVFSKTEQSSEVYKTQSLYYLKIWTISIFLTSPLPVPHQTNSPTRPATTPNRLTRLCKHITSIPSKESSSPPNHLKVELGVGYKTTNLNYAALNQKVVHHNPQIYRYLMHKWLGSHPARSAHVILICCLRFSLLN